MTVGEAVRFTQAFYSQWNSKLVEQILHHFELSRKQKLRRLSNGQRAQVSLALAVAPEPELLILDDPTLGLDTVVRRNFLESLIQIIQEQRSHDSVELAHLGRRGACGRPHRDHGRRRSAR